MIIKEHLESDYVQVPNSLAQHRGLSFFARGMLLYILSKPADWIIREKDLMNEGNCGRDRVRNAVKELLEAGYLTRFQKRSSGKFKGVEYVAHQRVQPSPEKPSTEKPTPVNPTHTKERSIQRKESTKDSTVAGNELTVDKAENGMSEMSLDWDQDDFGQWWNAYPKQIGEAAARKAYFKAADKTDRATLLRGAEGYAAEVKGRDKQYIKGATAWLNEELWDDYDYQAKGLYRYEGREINIDAETAARIGAKKVEE
jgi:hypothetical protein